MRTTFCESKKYIIKHYFLKALFLSFMILLINSTFAASNSNVEISTINSSTHKSERKLHSFPKWFYDSPFLDLEEATSVATSEGKKGLMLLFTTQGCSYCEQFIRESLGNSDIAKSVQRDFVSLGFEIFDDAEMIIPSGETMPVKQFAKQQGVGFAPTLLFFDNSGKRVLRQVGYQAPLRFQYLTDFVANKYYQSQSLRDFITSKQKVNATNNTYTNLQADTLFDQPPYALDRSHFDANEPLMILFEKVNCSECQTFHNDVMKLQHVRSTLKDFQVVRMDINDDKTPVLLPNGKFTTPAKWYKETSFSRLPALMFFDEKGNQVLETDALVQDGRMMNSLNYMLEKAYLKNWTYQQFARSKAIERSQKQAISQE